MVKSGKKVIKYRQIADFLRERIKRGQYRTGETIPSYPQLGELFEVSEITIRKAVSVLVQEERLEMQPGRGKGFYVLPPPKAEGRSTLNIGYLAGHFAKSDDPAIQPGILAAAHGRSGNLLLLPHFENGEDRLAYLKRLAETGAADGFIVSSQHFASSRERLAAIRFLEENAIRSVLIHSSELPSMAEAAAETNTVRMIERGALEKALARVRAKGKKRLLFLGVWRPSVERSQALAAAILPRGLQMESLILETPRHPGLYNAFDRAVAAANLAETTIVVEGDNLPLSYFDSVLAARGLTPGREVSCFFFEHFCALEPMFFSQYSSISRPYFDLGFRAGERLQQLIAGDAPPGEIRVEAVFNDLHTI